MASWSQVDLYVMHDPRPTLKDPNAQWLGQLANMAAPIVVSAAPWGKCWN